VQVTHRSTPGDLGGLVAPLLRRANGQVLSDLYAVLSQLSAGTTIVYTNRSARALPCRAAAPLPACGLLFSPPYFSNDFERCPGPGTGIGGYGRICDAAPAAEPACLPDPIPSKWKALAHNSLLRHGSNTLPKKDPTHLDFPVLRRRIDRGGIVKLWGLVGVRLRPEYYRRNALEILRQANTTSDPRSKAILIDMAVAWSRLADHVESIHLRPYAHPLTLVSDSTKRSV
jgi:hypothetical protein